MSDEATFLLHYPDLVQRGSLSLLIQAALSEVGSQLSTVPREREPGFVIYTRVETGPRFSQIYVAAEERLFLFDAWQHGVMLANCRTPDVLRAAAVIDAWISTSCSVFSLAAQFPDVVTPVPGAESFERGTEVEDCWLSYLASSDHDPELIRAASERPQLRQLFPFFSLDTLCFSRFTGYPYSRDLPSIKPERSGLYVVRHPSHEPSAPLPLDLALNLLVTQLPQGCGPAQRGTSEGA